MRMKNKEKKKLLLRAAAIILAFIFLISAAFLVADMLERRQGVYSDQGINAADGTASFNDQEYKLKENVQTVLVMGLDKFEDTEASESYNNDRQADFMLLLVFDNKNETCKALHINRDTMAEMNVLGVAGDKIGTATKQIALSHTYGNGKEVSGRNAANAVSKLLLGMKIDHFVSVPMDAVGDYTDLVGGVEVEVLDDFSGIDDTLIKGETVTLNGEHALNYVRTRYGLEDSSNQSRMQRQRQFMQALYQKTRQCMETDDGFAERAALKTAEYLVSDCSGNRLQTFMEKISSYKMGEIGSIQGEHIIGEEHMEFYPDEDSVRAAVIELFYELKE